MPLRGNILLKKTCTSAQLSLLYPSLTFSLTGEGSNVSLTVALTEATPMVGRVRLKGLKVPLLLFTSPPPLPTRANRTKHRGLATQAMSSRLRFPPAPEALRSLPGRRRHQLGQLRAEEEIQAGGDACDGQKPCKWLHYLEAAVEFDLCPCMSLFPNAFSYS